MNTMHVHKRGYPNPSVLVLAARMPNPHSMEIYKALRVLQIVNPVYNVVGFPRSNKYIYYPLYPPTKPYDNPQISTTPIKKPNLIVQQDNSENSPESKILLDPLLLEQIVKRALSQGICETDTLSKIIDFALIKGGASRMIALNYLLTHGIELSDQYYVTIKEILQELNKIDKDQDIVAITKAYEELFKNLKSYLESNLPSKEGPSSMNKNYKEYLQLVKHTNSNNLEMKKDFYEFIKTEKTQRCFLPEDFKAQIEQNEIALKTIFNPTAIQALTEQEILALLNRVEVVKYPDASYYVTLNAVDQKGSLVQDTYIEKEGEGVKILSKVYSVLVKNNDISRKGDQLSLTDAKAIVQAIEKERMIVGTIISDPERNTLVLSGKRLHCVVVIQDPRHENSYLIIGNLTSAEQNTIILSQKQPDLEDNDEHIQLDPKEQDKEQRFLLGKSFVRISKDEFKEKVKGTNYLQGNDEHGCSVVQKIVANFLQNKDTICNQPIEFLKEFTLQELVDSAKYILQKETQWLYEELGKLQEKLKKMDSIQHEKYLKKLKSQYNNLQKQIREKEYYEDLTRKQQVLYNLYKKLVELKEKHKEITKKITEKFYVEKIKAKKVVEKEKYKVIPQNNSDIQNDNAN